MVPSFIITPPFSLPPPPIAVQLSPYVVPAYIIPLFMENKCDAVFLAEPIADFLAVTTTAIMFLIVFKKSMKKIS